MKLMLPLLMLRLPMLSTSEFFFFLLLSLSLLFLSFLSDLLDLAFESVWVWANSGKGTAIRRASKNVIPFRPTLCIIFLSLRGQSSFIVKTTPNCVKGFDLCPFDSDQQI